MDSSVKALWAKKDDAKGRFLWLPLIQHLEDTRQTIGLLWEHWLSEGQRQLLIRSLVEPSEMPEMQAKKVVQFLGSVHDIGKATPAFQTQKGFTVTDDLDRALKDKLEAEGFRDISNLRLAKPRATPHATAGENLLRFWGVNTGIASIVGAHHGRPTQARGSNADPKSYPANYFQKEQPEDPIYQKWEKVQKDILDWSLKSNGFDSVEDLPLIFQPGQVILSGLVIMADWIASNEQYFPYMPLEENQVTDQNRRTQYGWNRWQKTNVWEAESSQDPVLGFEERFKFPPKDVQAVLIQLMNETDNPGIWILEAPMGSGKTEAALYGAEQLAAKKGKSGLFFGLPTQATSNGMFPRVCDWLERIKEEYENGEEDFPIRLAHGKAALNETFTDLAKHVDIDGEEQGSLIINDWFSGRKTVALDDFVVGTVDQFLLVALKQKHLALRHLGFSKKVVVIDEVHAYDAYMSQYLYRAIRWMGTYDVPVIILSATLPIDKRHELVKQYLRGRQIPFRQIKQQLAELSTDAYPLITYHDGAVIKEKTEFAPDQNKCVFIKKINEDKLMSTLNELIESDGVIGIIVNTVQRAQDIARICASRYGDECVELLHSRFIDAERIRKETALLQMIGKGKDRPQRKIIVGTQVLEQSLDIDFDVMISDLAPMDLLIQRIGRLHRHEINRPKLLTKPMLYLMGTDETLTFEEGSVAVYGGYLLARTQFFLPEVLRIPEDISPLVQLVYGKDPINLPESQCTIYKKMQEDFEQRLREKQRKAQAFLLDNPKSMTNGSEKISLMGLLDDMKSYQTDERAYAQVRDIQNTIEVIALKQQGSGYGFFGTEEDISLKIKEPETAKKMIQHTLKLPYALCYPNIIDETIQELEENNWRNLKDWQEKSWLKGSLGMIFHKETEGKRYIYDLNGFRLWYDEKYGLCYERMRDNGQV